MSSSQFELQDVERVRDYLSNSVADPAAREEFMVYLQVALPRFLITMEYLPPEAGRVLEIGSTPYFLTLLMKRFRPYQLELSNFFGSEVMDSNVIYEAVIDNLIYGEQHRLPYRQFNIERQVFPYETESLDGVVFCEVLEHLTADPMAALAEMHRVLKPGGWLLVTTPNAAWYENLAQLWRCHNIYSQYSAHGPYGRHNREYTVPEMRDMLNSMGFDVERVEARDLQPGRKLDKVSWVFKHLKPAQLHEEGLFCLVRKTRPLNFTRLPWLYSLGYKMPPPEHLRDRLPKQ
jgi:predicted SAM-dependent methyltransferase